MLESPTLQKPQKITFIHSEHVLPTDFSTKCFWRLWEEIKKNVSTCSFVYTFRIFYNFDKIFHFEL